MAKPPLNSQVRLPRLRVGLLRLPRHRLIQADSGMLPLNRAPSYRIPLSNLRRNRRRSLHRSHRPGPLRRVVLRFGPTMRRVYRVDGSRHLKKTRRSTGRPIE